MLLKKQKGVALITVLIIAVIVAIFGASLLNLSIGETRLSSLQNRKIQAHYIARSGIYVGINMVNNLIGTKKYPDSTQLTQALNAQVSNLSLSERTIGSTGYFDLSFEVVNSGMLKIKSTGNTGGTQNTTDNVTITMNAVLPPQNNLNPDNWVKGGNLWHMAAIPGDTYVRQIVCLDGKNLSIKSPMGGPYSPVYQASVIKFINSTSTGFSLDQVENTTSSTFDAQILYFESNVLLNESYNPIILSVSDTVLKNWILPNVSFIDISTGGDITKRGFADSRGYSNFIQGYTSDMYTANNLIGRYGLVYFGGDIYRGKNIKNMSKLTKIYDKGWYFFKDGTDLQKIGTYDFDPSNLIKVNSDDAAIKAVSNMLSFSGGTSNQMWDNK